MNTVSPSNVTFLERHSMDSMHPSPIMELTAIIKLPPGGPLKREGPGAQIVAQSFRALAYRIVFS